MKILLLMLAICALVVSSMAVKDDICALPHSSNNDGPWMCAAYLSSWSYSAGTNECVEFVYGGCGGNENRFYSKDACEEKCKE